MKILFVTRGFPSENDLMAGNYESVQAKALAARGCEVSVLSVYEKSFFQYLKEDKRNHRVVDGVDVYESSIPKIQIRIIKRINQYFKKWMYKQTFRVVVKDKGLPDIIHGHLINVSSLAISLKKQYGLPFVITEHWTKVNDNKIPWWLWRMSKAYHQADRVVCVSEALADSLKQKFQVDSIVINNMVSEMFFRSRKIQRHDKEFRFIACGAFRANGNKGFDILVEAFARACFPPSVSLSIIGDGEDKDNIEHLIVDHGLTSQIHLLGVKTPAEVNELLCQSDCFVLSSRLETFAIVVIEAMAKGLPVVATRSGGPETFLRPEHGLLVDKENVEELSDAMQHMVDHYADYDSEAIINFCRDHFSEDVIANKIMDVYKQVLNVVPSTK